MMDRPIVATSTLHQKGIGGGEDEEGVEEGVVIEYDDDFCRAVLHNCCYNNDTNEIINDIIQQQHNPIIEGTVTDDISNGIDIINDVTLEDEDDNDCCNHHDCSFNYDVYDDEFFTWYEEEYQNDSGILFRMEREKRIKMQPCRHHYQRNHCSRRRRYNNNSNEDNNNNNTNNNNDDSLTDVSLTSHSSIEENLHYCENVDICENDVASAFAFAEDGDDDKISHSSTSTFIIAEMELFGLSSSIPVIQQQQCSLSSPNKIKEVRFGSVSIREYSVIVGANAAVNDTCPLQLSWEYKYPDSCFAHLELYDCYKQRKSHQQRPQTQTQTRTHSSSIIQNHRRNTRPSSLPSDEKKIVINTMSLSSSPSSSTFITTDNNYICHRHIPPRRLSLEERRQRIAKVQNVSTETVEKMEHEIMIESRKIPAIDVDSSKQEQRTAIIN